MLELQCPAESAQGKGAARGQGRTFPAGTFSCSQLAQPCQQQFSNFHACSDGRVLPILTSPGSQHVLHVLGMSPFLQGMIPVLAHPGCPCTPGSAQGGVPAMDGDWMGFKIPPNPTQPGILYFSAPVRTNDSTITPKPQEFVRGFTSEEEANP